CPDRIAEEAEAVEGPTEPNTCRTSLQASDIVMKSTHHSSILVTGAAGTVGAIGRNLQGPITEPIADARFRTPGLLFLPQSGRCRRRERPAQLGGNRSLRRHASR